MKKLYMFGSNGQYPLLSFLESLPIKLQNKLIRQFSVMLQFPSAFGEPHIKHFKIERYREFYELREKHSGLLVRIIFALDDEQNIILLEPFIKTHSHTTERCLESAMAKLRQVQQSPAQFVIPLSLEGPNRISNALQNVKELNENG